MQAKKYRWNWPNDLGRFDYFEWLPEPDSTDGGGELTHVFPGIQAKVVARGTLGECTPSIPEGLTMEEFDVDIPEPTTDSSNGVSDETDQPQ